MKEMVFMGRAADLVNKFGITVVSPGYRLAFQKPYPPAYTFVGEGEPFYAETLEYVRKLKEAGVEAEVDVYPTDMHAFDMLDPENEVSKRAIRAFEDAFKEALSQRQD